MSKHQDLEQLKQAAEATAHRLDHMADQLKPIDDEDARHGAEFFRQTADLLMELRGNRRPN